MITKLLGWVTLLVVMAGCTEPAAPDPAMMGYQYYPLAVGDYRIYHVTDIRIQFDKADTSRYQVREIVKSSFLDQTNALNYRIERSKRPNSSSRWDADSVFVVSKSLTNVILTKDNTKRVKLVFPVKNGKTWLGDAYNSIGDFENIDQTEPKEPYTYTAVGEPFTLDAAQLVYNTTALHFDTTATVIQGEPKRDIIAIDDRKEVYAAGVGLVYRLFYRALLCGEETGCSSYIKDGNERHEVLMEHGKL